MREVKFRAYVKNRGMYKIVGYRKYPISITIFPVDSKNVLMDDWLLDNSQLEIMQYTGLKDNSKEKVEIYEGDIVKEKNDFEYAVIQFVHGCWMAVTPSTMNEEDDNKHFKNLHFYKGRFEVIGNIYQNGDLLCK